MGRKRRKHTIKFVKLFFLLLILIFLVAGASFGLSQKFLRKTPYISPLPTMPASSKPTVQAITFQDKLIKRLQSANISFSTLSASSDGSLIIDKDEAEIVFDPTADLDRQVTSLQLILTRLTIEGRRFTRLDLRFDNPIIVFK